MCTIYHSAFILFFFFGETVFQTLYYRNSPMETSIKNNWPLLTSTDSNVTDTYRFSPEKTLPFAYVIFSFLWSKHSLYNVELLVFTERIFYIIHNAPLFHCFSVADPRHLSQQNYRFLARRNVAAANSPTPGPPAHVATTFLVDKSMWHFPYVSACLSAFHANKNIWEWKDAFTNAKLFCWLNSSTRLIRSGVDCKELKALLLN